MLYNAKRFIQLRRVLMKKFHFRPKLQFSLILKSSQSLGCHSYKTKSVTPSFYGLILMGISWTSTVPNLRKKSTVELDSGFGL